MSVRLLGERVTRTRTLLLATGVSGVLLVVRPGFGMTPALGLAVPAGLFYGAFLKMSHVLADFAPPRQLMLSQTVLGTLLLMTRGLWHLSDSTWPVAGLVVWSGLASASGNILFVLACRRAGATDLAPFVYFQ